RRRSSPSPRTRSPSPSHSRRCSPRRDRSGRSPSRWSPLHTIHSDRPSFQRRLPSPQPRSASRSLPGSHRRSPHRPSSRSGRSLPSSPNRSDLTYERFQEESDFQPDYEEESDWYGDDEAVDYSEEKYWQEAAERYASWKWEGTWPQFERELEADSVPTHELIPYIYRIMPEEFAKLPPPRDSTLDDSFLTFENRELRRKEPMRLPLSNQLTKEVLIHSGALREGGQPLKRGSKFEDMPPP